MTSDDTTLNSIALSPAYRRAQRILAQWIEGRHGDARRERFALRTAWTALDATERDRMVRWLAWLCVAAASRGNSTLLGHLRRLDATWALAITRAMRKLPGSRYAAPASANALRLSA